jgi:hypothetical protein
VDLLKNNLPEHRDNRGKRHTLVLVIVGFVSATLVGRHKLSSVHRYICNRVDWLHEITQSQKVKPISRAHLPRFLNRLDWLALNELIERCFGVRIHYNESKKWIAIDGKALRVTRNTEFWPWITLRVKGWHKLDSVETSPVKFR